MHPLRSLSFRTRRLRHSILEVRRKRTVATNLRLPEIPQRGGVWAITLVRDEADVIGPVVDHLVGQGISRVLAVDHLSVDATPEILASKGSDVVTVVPYRHPGYHQGTIMTALARHAARCGAEWIVPFDADEMWYAPGDTTLADHLVARTEDVVVGAWWNYFPTEHDGAEPNPFDRITYRADTAKTNTKVAFRAERRITVAYGNHRVRPARSVGSGLIVAHYPYRSREQFVRKAQQGGEALRAASLRRGLGRHWRDLSELGDTELERLWDAFVETQELPFDWWTPPSHLVFDPHARLIRTVAATVDDEERLRSR